VGVEARVIALFAADNEWGIGRDGRLPWRLQGDLAYFKERTLGGVVIMGRRTFESIAADSEPTVKGADGPDGGPAASGTGRAAPRPLPGRTNVVLTRAADYAAEGVTVVHSADELLDSLRGGARQGGSSVPAREGAPGAKERGELCGGDRGVYVCGGADIYRLLMPYTDACLVTRIDASFGADTFFPLESGSADGSAFTALGPGGATRRFALVSESAPVTETDLASGRTVNYRFCEYRAAK
jgi:dihydrofolate reductase